MVEGRYKILVGYSRVRDWVVVGGHVILFESSPE